MHRTEGVYNQSNLFSNGPPGTRVEQNWLNAIQEEISYVIEEAGITLLTADTETREQLKQAMDALYTRLESGTIMLFGQNSAPIGWTRKTNWVNNSMLCVASTGDIASGGSANPQSGHTHGPGSYQFTVMQTLSSAGNYLFGFSQAGTQDPIATKATIQQGTGSLVDTLGWLGDNALYYTKDGTGVSSGNTTPAYQEVIAATKD